MKKISNQKFKFLFAFFLLFQSANVLFAQEWLWLGPGQISCNSKYSNGVAFVNDSEGNFLVTGYFATKSISFGKIILENKDTSGQTNDGFIAKFDKTGNIIWANSFGGNSYDEGNAICEDKNHNVYITGDYRSLGIAIGNYTFSNSSIDGIDSDVFIAKYDSNGKLIWAKSGGGRKNDRGTEIIVDTLGNVFVSGSLLSYSAKFDKAIYSNPDSLNAVLGIDFIAKIDKDGNVISVMEKDKELKELKKSWDLVFHKCLASNKIKISCAGCSGVRYSIRISVNKDGKIIDTVELENKQCGEKLSEPLKKCLMDYLNNYNFPKELRNRTFELRVDRTLKC